MSEPTIVHKGHCRCGGVAVTASAPPHFTGYCHCDDCRRSAGGALIAFVGFNRDEISWDCAKSLARYENPPATRLFCNHCGTPVGYLDARLDDRIYFYTGFMTTPAAYPPASHAYVNEKLPWLAVDDDLPKAETTSVERPR